MCTHVLLLSYFLFSKCAFAAVLSCSVAQLNALCISLFTAAASAGYNNQTFFSVIFSKNIQK